MAIRSWRRWLGLAALPLLVLAWALLRFQPDSSLAPGPALGLMRVTAVLLLMIPVVAFWTTAGPSPSNPARTASIVAGAAALVAASPAVLLPGLSPDLAAGLGLASALLLIPAAREWWPLLPTSWRSPTVQRAALDLGVVVILPLAVLFAAPIQLFPSPAWVDPGIYLGLALDYFDLVRIYGWNYHALRVSYVVPSQVLHLLLPPTTAWLTAVVGFHLIGLLGLYTGARLLWGRAAAAVAVLVLACNPVFLHAVTAGYVDGAIVAYLLLMFGALAAWVRRGDTGWLLLAGAAAALAILGHLMAAVPVGLLLTFTAIIAWQKVRARPVLILAAGAAGAVLTFVTFVHALSGTGFGLGSFAALRWIIGASVGGIGANYRVPLGEWLPGTTRLVPILLMPLVLAALWSMRDGWGRRRDLAILVLAIAAALVLPLYDLAFRGSTTQALHYAYIPLALTAIATAAVAAGLLPIDERRRRTSIAAVAAIAVVTAFLAPSLWRISDAIGLRGLPLAAAALLMAGLVLRFRHAGPAVRTALLLGVVSVACVAGAVNRDTRPAFRGPGEPDNREFFAASIFLRDALRPAEAAGRFPMFWYDRSGFRTADGRFNRIVREIRYGGSSLPLTPFDGFASLRFWDRALFSAGLARGEVLDLTSLLRHPATTMVVLDNGTDGIETAWALLGAAGVRCRLQWAGVHQSQSFLLRVGFLDILGRRAGPVDRCDAEGP